MGDAVIALIKENRSRFAHLQNYTADLDGRVNAQGHHVQSIGRAVGENSEKIQQIDAAVREISIRLAKTIEEFSQIKNIDQHGSEDIELKQVSAEALAGRFDSLSQQVDAVAKDLADSCGSLKSLAESVVAATADAAHLNDSTHELEKHIISTQSNLADLSARVKAAESSIGELGHDANGQFQPGQAIFTLIRPS